MLMMLNYSDAANIHNNQHNKKVVEKTAFFVFGPAFLLERGYLYEDFLIF